MLADTLQSHKLCPTLKWKVNDAWAGLKGPVVVPQGCRCVRTAA